MAAQENHLEVVKFLLDNGASQSLATEVRRWFFLWVSLRVRRAFRKPRVVTSTICLTGVLILVVA